MKTVNVDDVLKILHKYGKYIFVTDEKKYSNMVDEIANLKSLDQEPKIRHWILTYPYGKQNPIYECSRCHASNSSIFKDYCPNCGARMESKE